MLNFIKQTLKTLSHVFMHVNMFIGPKKVVKMITSVRWILGLLTMVHHYILSQNVNIKIQTYNLQEKPHYCTQWMIAKWHTYMYSKWHIERMLSDDHS